MADPTAPLTIESSIGDWLSHPVGRPVLMDVLARSGPQARALFAISDLPLHALVPLSNGTVTDEQLRVLVDAVVRTLESHPGAVPSGPVFESAPPESPAAWVEHPVKGRFANRSVIVTGAGSGIGRATALRIAREGGHVLAIELSRLRLESLLETGEGLDIRGLAADISSPKDMDRIADAMDGTVDAVGLVAGLSDNMVPLHEADDDLWERTFRINVDGPFRLLRAVIPRMLAQGKGAIGIVASQAGTRGSIGGTAYTAAKHAVLGMTRSAAYMYGPRGIRINAIVPRPTTTALDSNYGFLGDAGLLPNVSLVPPDIEAAQIASPLVFLLSDAAIAVSGAIVPSDEGWGVA